MTEEQQHQSDKLPIAKNEDVEFNTELADRDDLVAVRRAEAADHRQE
ncbi:YfhD family protein [Paenibacillus larvae]|uniref:YfhD family protein n=4 Tax=Paenibacillus larvae TaxID=1464 RepID=V9W5R6_9BACL|nr:YfhD family protein [Paenibacillus larvae]AHD06351.1 hypothetical protein ERIC2_c25621 [Paenibacillus larvae subsp. larvae DSM 25430]AQR77397.1 YfhD family protein [Paenibacillus larvae subsp. larvae]AQT83932.1 YfhD family protein [Paenibacillus larvae subsp. pulvifaciens]AQZ45385.1 YfhD family protein [Paenibacillus larvae subsp. pulvifaciens]ARF67176.1 YfhD family protein [Paenibacillus larvae subsp. pulvifaciens]